MTVHQFIPDADRYQLEMLRRSNDRYLSDSDREQEAAAEWEETVDEGRFADGLWLGAVILGLPISIGLGVIGYALISRML